MLNNKENNIEVKKDENQIKVVVYEEESMKQIINVLNSIPIAGAININNMKMVFDILTNPIPVNTQEEKK